VVAAKCGACCLSLVGPRICWGVGGTSDIPVEALFPEGRKRFELGSSARAQVLGIDAVGGPPHCDFADEGGARMASRCSPDWWHVTLAGVVLNLIGEVDDELGSFCQIVTPNGIAMERLWYVREPGERAWGGRREFWEAPIEDSGHVAGGVEFSSGGGCL
jgi:hypothetical protein